MSGANPRETGRWVPVRIVSVAPCSEWSGWLLRTFACGHGEVVEADRLKQFAHFAECRLCARDIQRAAIDDAEQAELRAELADRCGFGFQIPAAKGKA